MTGTVPIFVVPGGRAASRAVTAGTPPWWRYSTEVLDHLRLPYEVGPVASLASRGERCVAVFPSSDRLTADEAATVERWVAEGGVAVCIGVGALGANFGVAAGGDRGGHVVITGANGWIDQPDVALRALGGVALTDVGPTEEDPDEAVVLARWREDDAPAMLARRHGRGLVVVSGVDLWQSIVRIQQGDPVYEDGVPAADGTAAVDDGVLKCDDGIVLSYDLDRALPPSPGPARSDARPGLEPVPVFHRPHADLWRQVFLQVLFEAAARTGIVLPWLHYWPAGAPAVAHLSVDSDRNVTEEAETTLRLFDDADVRTTWCHVYPGGYTPQVVEAIAEHGHEHALHFNAVGDADIASWGWPQLRAQYAWAQAVTGQEQIVSNKNHYTRWEGWTEFYEWCQRLGIQIDESRGPSKQGNVGFPFGTTHLAFPLPGEEGSAGHIDVLMLPLHAQDLAWAAHESVRDVVIEQTLAHHGVAHFLFHPVHVHRRTYVQDACRELVALARERGMPWWTAGQLNAWERQRREVTFSLRTATPGSFGVITRTSNPISAATILLALPNTLAGSRLTVRTGDGGQVEHVGVERHGRPMIELTTDLAAGETVFEVSVVSVSVEAEMAGGTR